MIVSKSKNKLTAWSAENSEWPRRHWFKNWAWLVEEVALVFLTCHKARENESDQFAISLKFESDWLRKRREFSEPTTQRSKAKP